MPYGPSSTAEEVLNGRDLRGKRILVTGVSSGVGVETARVLAAHGATVVGTARDLKKAAYVVEAARHVGEVELVDLDLASLTSVRACADGLLGRGRPLDAIVANAGAMTVPFALTADGFETHFATNYLGHFLLVKWFRWTARRGEPCCRGGVSRSSRGGRFARRSEF